MFVSQNPQLREGYCAKSKDKFKICIVSEPSTTRGLLCTVQVFDKFFCSLRTLNYERAIVQIFDRFEITMRLRTLNYERAIVQQPRAYQRYNRLRTLNYERAIVLTEYNILYLLSNQIQKTDLFACN